MNLPPDENIEFEEIYHADNEVQSEEEPIMAENLFPGDCGQLPFGVRRVLIQLLVGPFLDAKHHGKLWRMLTMYEKIIRSRLAELFLDLVIDLEQRIAFTRQANTEELETPIILRRTNLTFIDSVLMLYLRQLLIEADVEGERAAIAVSDIYDELVLYEKVGNTDHAGFKKRISTAIENAKKRNILVGIPGNKDRYEISPILKLLFSAEKVNSLKEQYLLLAKNQPLESLSELTVEEQ